MRSSRSARSGLAGALLSGIMLSLIVTGCATTPRSRRPFWITSIPSMPEYYIGIGSSNTGVPGEDMRIARSRALADLASSISTHITSEQRFITRDGTESGESVFAEVVITESIREHLSDIETIGAYYEDEIGYWYFLGLDRKRWAQIQSDAISRLESRVRGIVANDVIPPEVSAAGAISALSRAWALLAVSPYAGFVEGEMFGRDGLILDLIESEIRGRIEAISILVATPVRGEIGRMTSIEIEVASGFHEATGPIELRLEVGGIVSETVTTTDSGSYIGSIDTARLPVGVYEAGVTLSLTQFGIDETVFPLILPAPREDFLLEIDLIRAELSVIGAELEIPGMDAAFRSLLSEIGPFRFESHDTASGTGSGVRVEVEVRVREAPRSEYTQGMVFVFMNASVHVYSDGSSVFSYRSDEVKEGGLDRGQADARAFNALIAALGEDETLRSGLAHLLAVR